MLKILSRLLFHNKICFSTNSYHFVELNIPLLQFPDYCVFFLYIYIPQWTLHLSWMCTEIIDIVFPPPFEILEDIISYFKSSRWILLGVDFRVESWQWNLKRWFFFPRETERDGGHSSNAMDRTTSSTIYLPPNPPEMKMK